MEKQTKKETTVRFKSNPKITENKKIKIFFIDCDAIKRRHEKC